MLRKAHSGDIQKLIDLENISFTTDRLNRRNFRYLLNRANALTLVYTEKDSIIAYVMLLFHRGTSLGRLYSIAVHPDAHGRGLGKMLIESAESAALERDNVALRLEVNEDNSIARSLYEGLSYRKIGRINNYYENGTAAIRYEKFLVPHLNRELVPVPFYAQTLDFTCGPSALIMAMAALSPEETAKMNRRNELLIWREATSIFMTSGHGGCDPFGLAVSARYRNFNTEIFVNEKGPLFLDSVRNDEKKDVLRIVHEHFMELIHEYNIPVNYRNLHSEEIESFIDEGSVPIVLISSYRIYHEKAPHWVVVTGYDERYLYVHDSFVDENRNRTQTDCINLPILKKDFERMARYGKSGLKAAIIISRREND